jgi:hypothetical protein
MLALTATQHAGLDAIKAALGNIAYGEAACGAYMKKIFCKCII